MAKLKHLTQKILGQWAGELHHRVDTLCETGQWSEEEWDTLYNEVIIPLRNAAIMLSELSDNLLPIPRE